MNQKVSPKNCSNYPHIYYLSNLVDILVDSDNGPVDDIHTTNTRHHVSGVPDKTKDKEVPCVFGPC